MRIARRLASSLALAAGLAQLAACGGGGGNAIAPPTLSGKVKTPDTQLQPKAFRADCSDFISYTADALTEQYLSPRYYAVDAPIAATPTPAPSAGGATPSRVSETNVQEAGVDEADLVKADSSGRFYILRDQELLVMKAYPASGMGSTAISRVPLGSVGEGFYAQDFFLDEAGRKLVVLATQYSNSSAAVSLLFDLANPDAPVELSRLSVSGYGLEARRIGARVHRVSRFDLPVPAWVYDSNDALQKKRDDYEKAQSNNDSNTASRIKAEIRSEIGSRVQQQGAASFLPVLSTRTAAGETSRSMACDSLLHPTVTTATGLALVESFNTDGSARVVSGLVNNAFLVYASAQNLYLAQTSGGWFFAPNQSEETVVYRLALSATAAAAYQGLAKVDGHIPGRYALSEYQGHLRVASNEFRSDASSNSSNRYTHLTVFKANAAGDMTQTGAVRDLAAGESLRGTRFDGARGYLVTFRQVDPLFAFDLSNPAAPALKSILKIPGFSSYLEPVGSDYLLTVGRAGDEQQLNGQLAIQLFDVRDLANVRLVSSLSPAVGGSGYSYSAAEYDPHAFTYFPDRSDTSAPGTLSLPLQSYSDQSSQSFSGFLAVRVDPTATAPLTELGRVDHQGFADTRTYCGGSGGVVASAPPACYNSVYASDPRRSVFVQDASGTTLFTISTLGIKASDATAPARELGTRQFD
ncbi:MAG: beta-propeller domain-containing protein [Pseudomonadota bacterium]